MTVAGVATALALAVVCLAPWAFGSVPPPFERGLLWALLLTLAGATLFERGRARWPALPPTAARLLGLVVLWPALQLLPLPPALLALVAPGSAAVWHPAGVAGELLGPAWRPISIHPEATARTALYLGTLLLLGVRLGPWLAERHRYRFAVLALAVAGLGLAGYAVFARQAFGDLLYGRIAVPTIAPFGPYVSKNHFAGWTLCVALLLLGTAIGIAARARARHGSRWTEQGAAPAALALACGLALAIVGLATGSRGGGVAFVAGLLVLGALRWSVSGARRGAIAVLALLLLAAGLAFATAAPAVRSRFEGLGSAHQEASGSFRLGVWRDTLALVAASPLTGSGLGTFADALPRFKTAHGELRVEHPENEWLELLAEGGLLGFAAVAWGLALLLRASVAAARACPDPWLRGVAHGALAALGALAVHGLIDFNLRIPANAALAAVMAALALAPLAAGERPRTSALSAAALAVLLALASLLPLASARPGWVEERRGAVARDPVVRDVKQRRLQAELRQAVARRPTAVEPWLLLAWVEALRGGPERSSSVAAHALSLDPRRPGLAEAVRRLESR